MSKISWGDPNSKRYSSGIDRVVLYLPSLPGIPWSGVTEIAETPSETIIQTFIDGQKVRQLSRGLDLQATINAYTYPEEFQAYSGYNHYLIKPFNLSYREMTSDKSYRIHLLYNVVASPTDKSYSTLGDSFDGTFSWDLKTKPENIPGYAPTSHLIIDTDTAYSWTVQAIEDQLYGSEGVIPNLPTPAGIQEIFEENAIFKVTDNGDGTVTVSGPDEAIQALANNRVKLNWPSVINISATEVHVSSL